MPFTTSSCGSGGHIADDDADDASRYHCRGVVIGSHGDSGTDGDAQAMEEEDVCSPGEEGTDVGLKEGREMTETRERGSSGSIDGNVGCGSPLPYRIEVDSRHEVASFACFVVSRV